MITDKCKWGYFNIYDTQINWQHHKIDTAFIYLFIYFRNLNTVITANVLFIPLHFTKTMDLGCKQYFQLFKTYGPLKIVCFVSSQSGSPHRFLCSSSRSKQNRSRLSSAGLRLRALGNLPPLLQSLKPSIPTVYTTYDLLSSDQWCLRNKVIKHLFVRSCTGRENYRATF